MEFPHGLDPHATFGYVAKRLNDYDLAYLHVTEPHIRGNEENEHMTSENVPSKDLRRISASPVQHDLFGSCCPFPPDCPSTVRGWTTTQSNDDLAACARRRHWVCRVS
jgi:hypothetical protein